MITFNLLPRGERRRLRNNAKVTEKARLLRLRDPEGVRAKDRERDRQPARRVQVLAAAWRHKLRSYGLTPESYTALLVSQGEACACCKVVAPSRGNRNWCVDHDHVTGRVRGLLCHRCNTAIGLLGDNTEGVRNALAYLEKNS